MMLFLRLGLSVIAAAALALLLVTAALNPPAQDIQQLFLLMTATGLPTVLLTVLLSRSRAAQGFASLRGVLLAGIVFTVALIFVNVWIVAQLMFISRHDLVLTAALLVFAGAVAVILVYFLAGTLIARIHALVRATEHVARGELDVQLEVRGTDELARLTTTFNQMAEALKAADTRRRQLEQARRDLVAWVSHDLRTPLTAIRVMNEAIPDGVVTDPQIIERYMRDMQHEIQHLSRLIDDLFELSRLDAGNLDIQREPTSLRDLFSDTIGSMRPRAERSGVTLTGSVQPGVDTVYIAPDKIQRVLSNLLENALRYTPPGGCITLRAERDADAVCVSVHNTGSLIAPTDLPRVFESFYQGEPTRAPERDKTRGVGLGLAIARGFVEAHGGTISVRSQPEQGTTFQFTLPV
ncbi:MAG: HAMP domain-containing histidine kinase [Chloroflexi bacterium]|nr:HAMP domain-containing histidine kinase [Chloroflexota bacterium]